MLTFLRIQNVALIDKLEVELSAGLCLLTGETGSGKSIIVDSIGALAGGRVTNDLVKQGSESATIEGEFQPSSKSPVWHALEAAGIERNLDSTIIIRRDISLAGKNRVFINGQLTTAAVLNNVGDHLVDIHGQGEQAALYDVEHHRLFLDEYAGHTKLLDAVRSAYERWNEVNSRLTALHRDENEKLQLIDILTFQTNEIERVLPVAGEDDELEAEKRRLANSGKITTLSNELYETLYDSENSTLASLERSARLANELGEFDAAFREFDEGLRDAVAVVEELARTARDNRAKIDFSPERQAEIEDRLAELSQLKRKYGGTIESILDHLGTSKERLSQLQNDEFHEEELRRQLSAAATDYEVAAEKLSGSRVSAAKKLNKAVETGLADVALERAVFETRVTAAANKFSSNGQDDVEFYFSANPGEPPRPLARVASGGEASRLMLTVKTVIAGNEPKTSVFDEVDTGIGGRVAEAVGKKLKSLSITQQVLCVTHQPQIAALADSHIVIEKQHGRDSTSVNARSLTADERIDEIARMLAGESITDAARENARVLLSANTGRVKGAKN
jgi:DNA repair protein RecN (Recombination protein N)